MKLLTTCLFALLLSQVTFAQQSIGFTDSTDFQYLINYRLPSWRYSQFSLNASSGNYDHNNQNLENSYSSSRNMLQTSRNSRGAVSFNPDFKYWHESEQRILSINSNYSFDYSRQKNTDDVENNSPSDFPNTEGRYKHTSLYMYQVLNIDASIKNYLNPDNSTFVYGSLYGFFDHNRRENKTTYMSGDITDIETTQKSVVINPRLAIGFGRIRNVTPVIRAIRVNERFKNLGNASLSDENITKTAEQFTKYQGYTRVYDRPLKYFWNDLSSLTNTSFSDMGAYDLMYLNDIFDEVLGSRYEGYEFQAGIQYLYKNDLAKQNRNPERFTQKTKQPGLFTSFTLYKNLNLYHQLNFRVGSQVDFSRGIELDTWDNVNYLEAGWLWNVADRLLLTINSGSSLTFHKTKYNDDNILIFHTDLSTNLTYFIENSLAITTGVTGFYSNASYKMASLYDSNIDQTNVNIMIGIKYFFTRNLF